MAFVVLNKCMMCTPVSNLIRVTATTIYFSEDLAKLFDEKRVTILVDVEENKLGFRAPENEIEDKQSFALGKKTRNTISLPYLFHRKVSSKHNKTNIPLILGEYHPEKIDNVLIIKNCFEKNNQDEKKSFKKAHINSDEISVSNKMVYFPKNNTSAFNNVNYCEIIVKKNNDELTEIILKPSNNKIDGRKIADVSGGKILSLNKQYVELFPMGRHKFVETKEGLLVTILKTK